MDETETMELRLDVLSLRSREGKGRGDDEMEEEGEEEGFEPRVVIMAVVVWSYAWVPSGGGCMRSGSVIQREQGSRTLLTQ